MRHQRGGRQFNRDTNARKALFRSLAMALVKEGHVVTTQAKGKTLRSLADKLMTIARGNDVHARRELHAFFGKKDVANVLVDRYVPINMDRQSGFTTLSALGNRAGDNAPMVEVKWLTLPAQVGDLKNPAPAHAKAKAKRAAAKPATPAKAEAVKTAKLKPAAQKAAVKKAAQQQKSAAKPEVTQVTKAAKATKTTEK